MWQEYAIEPAALVRSWNEFKVFAAGLGWEHGRLLAAFPSSSFKRLVVAALEESQEQPIKKATITNRLVELYTKSLIAARRESPTGLPWPEQALAAHATTPFHAVITLIARPGTTGLDDFDPSSPPWICCTERIVPRTAEALAAAAKRLFNHTNHVVIVDPHFGPHRSHVRATLEAYLDSRDHVVGSPFRLSLHVGSQALDRGSMHVPFRPDEFQRAVSSYVSPMLRSGQKVAVSIWDKIQGRERLHDRFILCEHGGLSIQGGADLGPAGETTTISRVSSETAREIISRFELSAPGQPNPFYQRVHTFEVN